MVRTLRSPSLAQLGFTLVEIMLVMAIFGVITSLAVPQYQRYLDKARETRAIAEIRMLDRVIGEYKTSNGALPEALADLGMMTVSDPWGHPYLYLKLEGAEDPKKLKPRKDRFLVPINSDFDLYSMGKDGDSVAALTAKASRDDIVRANDGAFIGLAVQF